MRALNRDSRRLERPPLPALRAVCGIRQPPSASTTTYVPSVFFLTQDVVVVYLCSNQDHTSKAEGRYEVAESAAHKRAKGVAAGKVGKEEVPLSRNRRLDAAREETATEVERSGSEAALRKAAQRLKDSGKPRKVLQVPQQDMAAAADAMR